ncbi:hypothetical protein [Streptomyces lomondensis]|uniref:DUF222 domain-containing protein n=1 Tax=Streptomyces lomondensis TaxID=68229 RepID=A0ABQ2WWR7_9ACTN|nr:hypothetical protein [Streptomyces lomondensis]MCF0078870.1 hypothetical protein [Streptomyces lomondensis]GGW81712.1 hypothetical protein GCM10010383_07110 [Streptomyces lomondensis]
MVLRREVADLVAAGPFPNEDAEIEAISETQRLLERIPKPVTDDEAQALATLFGPDNCFGLAWTLLHLIETAPGAGSAQYTKRTDNEWVQMLNARVEVGQRFKEATSDS